MPWQRTGAASVRRRIVNNPCSRFALAGGAFAISLVLGGCDRHEPGTRQLPPLVRTAQVAANTQPERGFTGVVSARVESC